MTAIENARVTIVGLGLMGGSLAGALKASCACREVVGVAKRSETAVLAVQRGLVDRASTDLARTIHKDIQENLKFARVWGQGVFDGQTVQQEHVLEEGDVVELHS